MEPIRHEKENSEQEKLYQPAGEQQKEHTPTENTRNICTYIVLTNIVQRNPRIQKMRIRMGLLQRSKPSNSYESNKVSTTNISAASGEPNC